MEWHSILIMLKMVVFSSTTTLVSALVGGKQKYVHFGFKTYSLIQVQNVLAVIDILLIIIIIRVLGYNLLRFSKKKRLTSFCFSNETYLPIVVLITMFIIFDRIIILKNLVSCKV